MDDMDFILNTVAIKKTRCVLCNYQVFMYIKHTEDAEAMQKILDEEVICSHCKSSCGKVKDVMVWS